jgi:mono/diheme cytochrome c family protein
MKYELFNAFIVVACVIGVSQIADAQLGSPALQSVGLGKNLYDANCTACHGPTGKGDGFYAEQLKSGTKVPNLTELSKKNNGVFPFAQVSEIIDGTKETKAHGTRDMPIWGREFSTKNLELNPYQTPEAFARAKIIALTEYIYTLQTK